jgi:L-lysine 6-transaminase
MAHHKSFNTVTPGEAISVLEKYILEDGFRFTIDLEKCHGCYLYDSLNGREILDLFSFFATKALGHNHPSMYEDEHFTSQLLVASIENPTNSDFYTTQYANFLETFAHYAMPEPFRHAFFISGGTLAVENALKVAMDWKVRKNIQKGVGEKGFQVIHFRQAFHGRSGYTMSLTNSKPVQTMYFTQFNWPRIDNPKIIFPLTDSSLEDLEKREAVAVSQIRQALQDNPNDICAIIIEPIQSEGGDNHFRGEFLRQLRHIADENDVMLIFDEVQNGVGLTGKFWAFQHFNVIPDIVAFGKKMQTCGIIVTGRVDEVEDNCFRVKGRLNSTWGGNLSDMIRATRIMRIMDEERLVENAATQGDYLLEQLLLLQKERQISGARGRGLQCAFDLPSGELRNEFLKAALGNNLLLGGAGDASVRFRPAISVDKHAIDKGIEIIDRTLRQMKL